MTLAAPQPAATADGLPMPERRWAMTTVMLATILAVLDGSIANVALPTMARDLHADAAASIWVVNAYQLAIVLCLLPLSSLGDIHGYRRVYRTGLCLFTVASLACALAPSLPVLVAARVVQGLGAAGIMSVNGALVRTVHPRAQLGRGIGMLALVVSTTAAAGPTIASGILSVLPWPWLFGVNLPIGALAIAMALRWLPASPRLPHPFDLPSAILSAATFGLLIASIDGLGHGEPVAGVVAELGAAAALGVVLVRRQTRLVLPMIAVDLFRRPLFSLSVVTAVCSFAAATLGQVSLPFYFQDVLGRSQVDTGLLMTPWPLASAVTAPIAGRLADRYRVGVLGSLGLALLSVGLMLLATLPASASVAGIAWRMALCGTGFALFQSPNNRTLMSSAPRERSGAASGVLSTARLLGQTTGAAMVALIFGVAGGPVAGTAAAILAGAAVAAAAAVVSGLRLVEVTPARSA